MSYMGMDDFGEDFGEGFGACGGQDHLAGPLIGGGATQVGILATKLLFKTSPTAVKWSALIGTVLGAGVSGLMMLSPKWRGKGMSGLVTALLVGLPRQAEDLLRAAGTLAGLGAVVAEREIAGEEDVSGYFGAGSVDETYGPVADEVQLLDSGSGSTGVLGTVTAERETAGAGPQDIEMLGAGGFGANFLG